MAQCSVPRPGPGNRRCTPAKAEATETIVGENEAAICQRLAGTRERAGRRRIQSGMTRIQKYFQRTGAERLTLLRDGNEAWRLPSNKTNRRLADKCRRQEFRTRRFAAS